MMDYYFSYASDFLYGLNVSQLCQEIAAAGTIAPTVIGINFVGDNVTISFSGTLSSGEQTALSNLVHAHRPKVLETVTPYILTKIKEESVQTGENFMSETIEIIGATGPNVITESVFSWPIAFTLLEFNLVSEEIHRGSIINANVAPHTLIGYITAPIDAGATGIYVSETVIGNTMVGYHLDLFTGLGGEDLGRVIAIDKTIGRITTEFLPTQSYTAYPPTFVRQTIYAIRNYRFGAPTTDTIGSSRIGGSYCPKNTPIHIFYTNASNQRASILVRLEYLY